MVLIVAAAVLFLLATSLRGIARFYTDALWFSSLGQEQVFWSVLRTKIGLAVAFSTLFALLLWVNLAVAHRLAPTNRSFGPGDELLSRYQDVVERRGGVVRVGFSVMFGLVAGVGVSSQWREWLLFSNSTSFNQDDPLFGLDVGFYVFQLPFLSTVVATLFASVTVILLITIVAHYLNGGIDLNASVQRVAPAVKAHVSVLLGLLALIKAADYWLSRYELTLSTRGYVNGAGYTDVEAQLPALELLFVIALLSAGLFIWNIRRRGWVLPAVAVGLWALVAIVAGTAYPEFIQRFQVEPAESQREAPYIADNIAATRDALGIADVETLRFDYQSDLSAEELIDNEATVRNIRLLDPKEVQDTYQQLQRIRGFYGFAPLDIDRYPIDTDGTTETQVVLGSRELLPDEVPQQSWEGTHLAFTHGYGVALSPANAVNSQGQPNFIVKDVPVRQDDEIDLGFDEPNAKPQIYFGEGFTGYSIVNTARQEVDFINAEDETEFTSYGGSGGVGMGTFIRKAAFALRFGDINPLISDLVGSDSRIIFERDVNARVRALAPFLTWDADPYPVVIDGRIKYVVEGYTTSANYPYGQRADVSDLPGTAALAGQTFNYARNSVKAVVDAYDGTVTMYVIDPNDPVVQAWRSAFPTLFTDGAEVEGTELEAHFRYPQELFRVQTAAFARYHLTDPDQFYEQTNGWSVAQDPGRRVFQPGDQSNTTPITNEQGIQVDSRKNRVSPYYVQMSLPDEDEEQFLLLRSFVPFSEQDTSQNLTAFMVAGSDPGQYGKLTVYQMPSGEPVEGPSQVASQMESDEAISQRLSLLNVEGTTVRYGDLLLIPIEESILYVRPVFLQSDSNPIPVLANVIVDNGSGRPIMRTTLREALIALYVGDDATLDLTTLEEERPDAEVPDSGNPDGTGTSSTTTSSTTSTTAPDTTATTQPTDGEPKTVDQLLLEAQTKFDLADAVLREQGAAGLDEYLALVADGQALVRQAIELNNLETAVPTGESTTTTAPPAESTTTVPGG